MQNKLLEEIYSLRQVKDAQGKSINPFPTATNREEGTMLYDLVRSHGAKKTLEIGMAYGISTLFICQALTDNGGGRHAAIDPFQKSDWSSIGLLNVQRSGFQSMFEFREEFSYLAMPDLVRKGERFDLIFIDGSHLFDFALLDFFYADRLLPVGGVIVLDDLWMPGLGKLLAFILSNRTYRIERVGPQRTLPFWKPITRLARSIVRAPSSILEPYALYRYVTRPGEYCVLVKQAEDDRDYRHYRPF